MELAKLLVAMPCVACRAGTPPALGRGRPTFPPGCPSTVGLVRSGDRPAGNTAASDQPAAAASHRRPRDIGADGSAATAARPHRRCGGPGPGRPDRDGTAPESGQGPARAGTAPGGPASRDGREPGHRDLGARPERRRRGQAAARLGPPAQAPGPGRVLGPGPQEPVGPMRQPSYPAAGGAAFARLTVLPAILLMAWLLPGLPLLLAGEFLPAPSCLSPCRWPSC